MQREGGGECGGEGRVCVWVLGPNGLGSLLHDVLKGGKTREAGRGQADETVVTQVEACQGG